MATGLIVLIGIVVEIIIIRLVGHFAYKQGRQHERDQQETERIMGGGMEGW